MSTETALDVPALMIKDPRQALPEGSPGGRLWPAPPGVAAVQGNDGASDAEVFAAKAVVVFGIVASIGPPRVRSHHT
jgi:hypothetical protein